MLIALLSFVISASAAAEGGKIAFLSDRDGKNQIFVVEADGTGVRRVTDGTAQAQSPAWSPDGRRLAYASEGARSDIYACDADGSNVARLTKGPENEGSPAWSPDGKRIAYISKGKTRDELFVMNADGSEQKQLTRHDDGSDYLEPRWSPDGGRLIFEKASWEDLGGGMRRAQPLGVYAISADGSGGASRLIPEPKATGGAISPGGRWIVYAAEADGNDEIFIAGAQGGTPKRLTRNSAGDWYPSWSPDGQRIVFISDRDGNDEVYTMALDGSDQRNVSNNAAWESQPAWGR